MRPSASNEAVSMPVLVDYACPACSGRVEAWVPTPAPPVGTCPACGSQSRRVWSPVGLSSGSGTAEPAVTSTHPVRPLCATNPDVPGLCHMSPSAGRAWVARARGDGRALDRELARQERAAAITAPTVSDVLSHTHGHADAGTLRHP